MLASDTTESARKLAAYPSRAAIFPPVNPDHASHAFVADMNVLKWAPPIRGSVMSMNNAYDAAVNSPMLK
ncbi:hypothetical protein D3C83_277620 [compost metagenome]